MRISILDITLLSNGLTLLWHCKKTRSIGHDEPVSANPLPADFASRTAGAREGVVFFHLCPPNRSPHDLP